MDKLERIHMITFLLKDTEESMAKYISAKEDGCAYVGLGVDIGDSRRSIVQRIDVARAALLKLRKEMEVD